jgi:hypothetical protein
MWWSVFERICPGITCNYVCFPNLVWFMDFQLQAMPAVIFCRLASNKVDEEV